MSESRLSPFEIAPEIMARIRPMRLDDVDDVARLHQAAMGRSLWAMLGRRFLREVYRGLVAAPGFLGYVYDDGRVRGFIAGAEDGKALMRRVLRHRWASLGAAAAIGLARRPGTLWPLVETFRYFRRSARNEADGVRAESFFCSFEPDLRGTRISGAINKVLFDELARKGHRHMKITTESDNSAAKRQLTSWGFQRAGTFRFYGKDMIAWHLDLAACERIDGEARRAFAGRGES